MQWHNAFKVDSNVIPLTRNYVLKFMVNTLKCLNYGRIQNLILLYELSVNTLSLYHIIRLLS